MTRTIKGIVKSKWFWVTVILLINLVIKWVFIDFPIGHDEPRSLRSARKSLIGIFTQSDKTPPLFYIILHGWIQLFGESIYSIRFLPYVFSCFSAAGIFLLGKRFYGLETGIIATLLLTFSNVHILQSHNARVYSMFAFLTISSMYFYFSLIQDSQRKRDWIGLGISNVLFLYAHNLGGVLIFIQFASILSWPSLRQRLLKGYLIHLIIVGAFFAPYLPYFIHQITDHSQKSGWMGAPNINSLYGMLKRYSNAPLLTFIFVGTVSLAGFHYIYFKFLKGKENLISIEDKITAFWFLVPYLALYLYSQHSSLWVARYLIFVSIAYYLLIGRAVDYLINNTYWKWGAVVLIAAMIIFTCRPMADGYSKRGNQTRLVYYIYP